MLKLNPGERIYLIKRRHWLIVILQLFPFVLMGCTALLAIFLLFFIEITWPQSFMKISPQLLEFRLNFIVIFLLSLLLPVVWLMIFFILTYYYLTYWVVTNQRTIYVTLNSFFNISYSSVFHNRIQDIVISIKGILPAIFHFGNLQIQTAGEAGTFIFDGIPEPEIVKQVIIEAKRDYGMGLKTHE